MNLPSFWRRGTFTVPEVATLTGRPEATIRTYMARTPIIDFMGMKQNGRLYLSAQDAFYFWLVAELCQHGIPARPSMLSAAPMVNDIYDELPKYGYLVVTHRNGVASFELTDEPSFDERTTVVIPLRKAVERLIEKAAEIYATEAT